MGEQHILPLVKGKKKVTTRKRRYTEFINYFVLFCFPKMSAGVLN